MKLAIFISGLFALFLFSLKSENHNPETNRSLTSNVCFEQRSFDFLHELENIESNLIISLKQFSKNDKKRTSDSTSFQSGYLCQHSISEYFLNSKKGPFLNLFFLPKKSQSLLQVFLL